MQGKICEVEEYGYMVNYFCTGVFITINIFLQIKISTTAYFQL